MRPKLSLTLILWAASPARGAPQYLMHCPERTLPARTVDPARPWVCISADERYRNGIECPSGYASVTTADRYDPFKCALREVYLQAPKGICPSGHRPIPTSEPGREYECEKISGGFLSGPGCPKGTRPVPTPGALTPFRCSAAQAGADPEPSAEPSFERAAGAKVSKGVVCPKGTRRVHTENPFNPLQCQSDALPAARFKESDFNRYRIPGQLSFEYPRKWHLTDAWKDEVPSLLIVLDIQRDGKPVTLSITRQRKGTPAYEPMDSMLYREKNWRGAREEGKKRRVGGLPAALLTVPGDSRTAFIGVADGYYVISYSAPADLYEQYMPVYDRLLGSFSMPSSPGGVR